MKLLQKCLLGLMLIPSGILFNPSTINASQVVSQWYLWLAVLQVIWVNSHVFFILGPLLIALFWLQAKLDGRKDHAGVLRISFGLTLAMCLVNPPVS